MPTAKQKKLAEKVIENHRADKPKSIGKLMVESGYSPNTAIMPSQITKSKGFLQVLEEAGVTDDKISRVMNEGLEANRVISAKVVGKNANEQTDDFIEVPDHPTRHKFLETALKVKGLTQEQPKDSGNTYNTFIQQNNLNPNAPEAKELVDSTLELLMEKTKRHE